MLLTTDEFWKAMCSPKFVRLSLLSGAIEGVTYTCELAPEQVPGFLEQKIDDIHGLRGLKPLPCTTK